MRDIFKLYKGHRLIVTLVVLLTVITVTAGSGYSYLISTIVSAIGGDSKIPLDTLVWISVGFAIFAFVLNIVYQYVSVYTFSCTIDKIKIDLRNKIFRKALSLSYSWYDNHSAGYVMSIIQRDVDRLDKLIYTIPTTAVSAVVSIVVSLSLVIAINKYLLLLMLPPLVLLVLMEMKLIPSISKSLKLVAKELQKEDIFTENKLNGVRTIISFGKEDYEAGQYNEVQMKCSASYKKKWALLLKRSIAHISFDQLTSFLILVGGVLMLSTGLISSGDLVFCVLNTKHVCQPILMIASMAKDIQESMVAYKRVAEFLDTEEEIQNSVHTTKEKLCGDISFNKISFGYDKKEPVLKDINLKINKGEFVAFVGPSGCGKSTLAGLIPRFYDVESGSVSIDGINVKDIDLHTLRQEIGIVQQDIYLFNGTVYDNIAYAVPEASFDDVVRAAKLANAHDFITSLSDGYNTDIGDKGVKLSGGQKQRIAIARLFLLNPQIVIFDEATSALDNNSEKVVQGALEKIASDRTTIVIAHRLSTIRNADKIVFLSTNGIEEVGTHDELMELGGCYAQLYNSSNH